MRRGRHFKPARGAIPDDIARQAAHLADVAGVDLTVIIARLRSVGIVSPLAARRAIRRGRRLATLAHVDESLTPSMCVPAILTTDEQLDAIGAGAECATPIRGLLCKWRDACRYGLPEPIAWTPADGYVWAVSGVALSFDECERLGLDGTARSEPRRCPQCGEVIVRVRPTEQPWSSTTAGRAARWSHLVDGSPCCPRIGPGGYVPDEPDD